MTRSVLLALQLAVCATATAGTYLFAEGQGNPDVLAHPPGADPQNGIDTTVKVCIVPGSPNASSMEISVANVVDRLNLLVPTQGNVRSGTVSGIDFESVALHEIGHCTGLAHVNLASESGLLEPDRNYTKTLVGGNGIYDLGIGADGVRGSADDARGDDVNLHWFTTADNDPFDIRERTPTSSNFSVDIADLPGTDSFVTNSDRDVSVILGYDVTEGVMQQLSFGNEVQRALAADEVRTLLFARNGADRAAGGGDDYDVAYTYGGISSASDCDINVSFNDAQTGFAVCQTSGSGFLPDIVLTSANSYFNTASSWVFSATRIPLPQPDTLTVSTAGSVSVTDTASASLLSNDLDQDGAGLELSTGTFGGPFHGAVTLNSNGTFLYTNDGTGTSDEFVYRVCVATDSTACAHQLVSIAITANGAPIAVPDSIVVDEGESTSLLSGGATSLLDNDSDPDGDSMTVSLDSGPTNGSLTLNGDGTFLYTHDGSETASDSFIYRTCDPEPACDTATVSITVDAVNDPPNTVPDSATVSRGGTVTRLDSGAFSVLDNDTDAEGDTLTASAGTLGPVNGTVLINPDGTFSYTHDGTATTTDSFGYLACDDGTPTPECIDGSVTITITAEADVIFRNSFEG